MEFAWYDLVGSVGVLLILLIYLLLQLGRLSAGSLVYSAGNGIGAFLILVSLWHDFNLAAFAIEAAWLVISAFGVVRYYLRRPVGA